MLLFCMTAGGWNINSGQHSMNLSPNIQPTQLQNNPRVVLQKGKSSITDISNKLKYKK